MNESEIIEKYNEGMSLNALAREYKTYPSTVSRILKKRGVQLRHDSRDKGEYYVQDGEKLIEWAKAQGRLVTKTELAAVIGTKRLSPSYFMKYPELSKYVVKHTQNELKDYYTKLYNWLDACNIHYKSNDRTKLGISLDALLLDKYEGLAIQIVEKPTSISRKKYSENASVRAKRAKEAGIVVVYLDHDHFENLDSIKDLLDSLVEVRR